MKNIIFSKTAWVNTLTLIAPAIAYLVTNLEIVKPIMTPTNFAIYTIAVGVINILVRRFTSKEVRFTAG